MSVRKNRGVQHDRLVDGQFRGVKYRTTAKIDAYLYTHYTRYMRICSLFLRVFIYPLGKLLHNPVRPHECDRLRRFQPSMRFSVGGFFRIVWEQTDLREKGAKAFHLHFSSMFSARLARADWSSNIGYGRLS